MYCLLAVLCDNAGIKLEDGWVADGGTHVPSLLSHRPMFGKKAIYAK